MEGEWTDDLLNGQVKYTAADGTVQEIEVKDGELVE